MTKIDIGCKIDLQKLIETRLLIQANSGAGKSYAVRKLIEEVYGKVMFIILDIEGEYHTLREKYDVLLIGGNHGDVPISLKAAPILARKILEEKVPTIIDISELKAGERIQYVSEFLKNLMELPQNLRMPCLVIVEEAHKFCGQQEKVDSVWAVIDLMTRGRKRGYCGVLVTQRISKLHKDASAEANNKLVGRTFQDIDRKRAADEIGFSTKEDILSLRDLKEGEFYAFGVAIEPHHVHRVKIKQTKTKHMAAGRLEDVELSEPTGKLKAALAKLAELPKEAEREKTDKLSMQKRIRELEHQLKSMPVKAVSDAVNKRGDVLEKKMKAEIEIRLKREAAEIKKQYDNSIRMVTESNHKLLSKLNKIAAIMEVDNFAVTDWKNVVIHEKPLAPRIFPREPVVHQKPINRSPVEQWNANKVLSPAYTRMLKAAAMFSPDPVTRSKMAVLAKVPVKASTFRNGLSRLKSLGYIQVEGEAVYCTDEGREQAGDFDALPQSAEDSIRMWMQKLSPAYQRLLQAAIDAYPEWSERDDIAANSNVPVDSSTFRNGISRLKTLGLIKVSSGKIMASEDLVG
jgi:hypothetical protein